MNPTPTHILVVEDEPIVALDLQQRLEKMGYRVPSVVATGEAAIAAAVSERPQLVLMDISLAGPMDGVEAAEQITNQLRVPVVFLTAFSNDQTLERAKLAEPYGYLLKPFEERELQTTIEVALYKHKAEQALREAHDELELRVAERTAELQQTNEALQREIAERTQRDLRRTTLARVREQVWRMRTSGDIDNVVTSIWEGLDLLGLPFQNCVIQVIDPKISAPPVTVYDHQSSGPRVLPGDDDGAAEAVVSMWKRGQTVYRKDLREEDPHHEFGRITDYYGEICSVLDVPFSHGTLAVNSSKPVAFSDEHVAMLEELAEALSEGFRRLADLHDLEAERERLAVTLRSIADSVVATDADGRIVLMNRVAESLTGWSQKEAIGKTFPAIFDVRDEETGEPKDNPVDRALVTGSAIDLDLHTILVARDGRERLISTSTAPIRDDEGKTIGVVLVSRDVAALRKMEEELLKTEKLESLGVLAGGIAHDFNNILTTIIGYLSLAKGQIEPASGLFEHLSQVEAAADRATDLTHQLLAFAKGGAPVKQAASMAELLRDSATFTTRGSNVACVFDIDEDLWTAEVDPGQISQVIQNLVINADQAMPDGGRLFLDAHNFALGDGEDLPLAAGLYLHIVVRDQGIGISEEHLQRIFDPYFTTKREGSGLGLATAYAIIKNHDGHVTVTSSPDQGTTFAIYLPASTDLVSENATDERGMITGEGRVLVVDDERQIRRLAGEMLTRLGYVADYASDGSEAISKYRNALERGDEFDVVIMDLTIPGGMGGREALGHLLDLDEETCAVVSSGYSDDPVMADYAKYGFSDVVAKPYDIVELSHVLDRVLTGRNH
ncbi:MAG: response regulator [Gemmatimonadetes bacterium]|jgi:PAS domain S-box-containing protein|nr:response regulator [Gemmatimonadota bacterium]